MSIILRPYQETGLADIFNAWLAGHQNVLYVAATGSGKTVTFSEAVRRFDGPAIAIAHRQELVGQISLALARNGIRHRIIAPDSVIRFCVSVHMRELKRSYYDANARVGVAGVDTLIRRTIDRWLASVRLVVMDECFPAGTMVGNVPIESIAVGDYVDAYDENTNTIVRKKVMRLFKNKEPKYMMRLTIGHHVIRCTEGHPFYTKRGWINASQLHLSDEVLHHDTAMHNVFETCGHVSDTPPQFVSRYWARILFERLLKKILLQSFIGNDVKNKSKTRFSTDEIKQSYAQPGNARASESNVKAYKSCAENTRWEWSTADSRRTDSNESSWLFGICRTIYSSFSRLGKLSTKYGKALQNRCGTSDIQDSSRSGRCESSRSARSRRAERYVLNWVRVDRIEVYKPTNNRANRECDSDGFVYNIEVEDVHTYTVNGVIVHNCHHVLKANKWGAAFDMFPQAVGLGVTATPCRADGRGLGRHADGVFDTMILAPTMRDMIEHGYLTDYRIFAPPSDLDLSAVPVAASGEYSPNPLRKAVHKSHIVGDVVEQYLKIAPGKLGVTFSVDVESATDQAAAFRQTGVPAEVVSAKTSDPVRVSILRKFAGGEIKQLVNVDLFGEGFDLPAIETVCMARPTQSFSLFSQQFGRALRTMPGKDHAIIIDHVQNIHRHGLPDAPQRWTLDRREKRSRSSVTDAAAVRTCPECTAVYLRELGAICPYCSHEALPPGRRSPAQVDGDLYELDAETLRQMRGEIDKPPVYPVNAAPVVVASINKNHRLKTESQAVLRETMAYWAAGMDDIRLAQRRFFIKFGVDVMTAQTLNKSDAELLTARLIDDIVNRT